MEHRGPSDRVRREAAAMKLQEASFRAGIEITKLSRYERGLVSLSEDEMARVDAVIDAALRERRLAIEQVCASERQVAV